MSTQEFAAAVLGTKAFQEGRKPVPCHDKELLELVRQNPNKEIGASLPLLTAWSDAWHLANRFSEATNGKPA